MDQTLLNALRRVDTPTVCNAIETAEGKRGFMNFTRRTMVSSEPEAGAIVGYARTATIAASAPCEDPPDTVRDRRMAYYRHMADAPRPTVAVIEDLDGENACGAYWGEINTSVHKGFGIAGALTNGLVRDLGDLPKGFPVIAGGVGPSHAFVHVREFGTKVTILGMEVEDGDLIHADRHGAAVIPAACIPTLAASIDKLQSVESIVLNAAKADGFDLAAFEAAWAEFEKAKT